MLFVAIISSSTLLYSDSLVEDKAGLKENSELIYIQQAKVAELSVNPNAIDSYLLKVSGSDKTLVYFSDKPDRLAGTLTLSQFVKTWQHSSSQQEESPNAVISYVEFKASTDSGVGADILQLSNPVYDACSESVTFEARPLHEYEIMTGTFENLVIVYDGIKTEECFNKV